MGLFDSFGFIPDVLRGKDPKDALLNNVAAVGSVLVGGNLPGMSQGPGLLGGGPTGPGLVPGASNIGMTAPAATPGGSMYSLLGGAPSAGGMTAPAGAQLGGSPGMFDSIMGGLDKYGKPVGNALSAANSAQSLMQRQQPQAAQTVGVMRPGPDAFQGLMQQDQQIEQQRQQDQMQRRLRNNQMIRGLLGG